MTASSASRLVRQCGADPASGKTETALIELRQRDGNRASLGQLLDDIARIGTVELPLDEASVGGLGLVGVAHRTASAECSDAEHFVDGGQSRQAARPAILHHRRHALGERHLLDRPLVSAAENLPANSLR